MQGSPSVPIWTKGIFVGIEIEIESGERERVESSTIFKINPPVVFRCVHFHAFRFVFATTGWIVGP
jgi:hypothetical protein